MSTQVLQTPYCGLPPAPADLWARWNFDPILISVLVVCAAAYGWKATAARRQGQAIAAWRQASFYVGWAITALALISPLCPLSVSLFAARVGQHIILALIGAPLVVTGRPFTRVENVSNPATKPRGIAPLSAAALFAASIWFWHAPAPYAETFRSSFVYWSMHVSVYGAALWLWASLIDAPPAKAMHVVLAGLFSSIQMGFLGALITFAPRALYTPHLLTTVVWNLTPLQDQQLGGAIMWVPGCVLFFITSMLILWQEIIRSEIAPARANAVSR
ncbi:MAG: cytochrome c oxidase assembly protein [Methylovirgula sp.]|uniref:cytochrome c oxidase assembly protein n=1 Tax=Methylovirgula sp. TaxID=1978224 RepID=UPI0030761747